MQMLAIAFGILFVLVWIVGLLSLIATGAIFGFSVPGDPPLWISIIVLTLGYFALSRIVNQHAHGSGRIFAEFVGLVGIGFALWYGYTHIPAVRDFFNAVPRELESAWNMLRALLVR
jgi:hypothetical protein